MILSTVISPVFAASQQQNDLLSRIFVFDRYSELVQLLQNSILAGAVSVLSAVSSVCLL